MNLHTYTLHTSVCLESSTSQYACDHAQVCILLSCICVYAWSYLFQQYQSFPRLSPLSIMTMPVNIHVCVGLISCKYLYAWHHALCVCVCMFYKAYKLYTHYTYQVGLIITYHNASDGYLCVYYYLFVIIILYIVRIYGCAASPVYTI